MSEPEDGTSADGPAADGIEIGAVTHVYGKVTALGQFSLSIAPGAAVAIVGPDGVGKSTLLSLIAGATRIQQGTVSVLGADLADRRAREAVQPRIAFMPQGLGRNLYANLSVKENIAFFARLFGARGKGIEARTTPLLEATGLAPFGDRLMRRLSGGMKQKLGLCCALVHDPDLLVLDEPTTGVDPLSRRQFWDLIEAIRAARPGLGLIVATSDMDEAMRFARVVMMDGGRILADGTPAELLARTGCDSLERAFISLLPPDQRGDGGTAAPAAPIAADAPVAIEAHDLTRRFGPFVAVDSVSFSIRRGEIFGFLGSNGCGKSTTMKMLTGLLPASSGEAKLFGRAVDAGDIETRRRVGYMSQAFSLYGELTVRQNLELHAAIFSLEGKEATDRIAELTHDRIFSVHPDAAGKLPLVAVSAGGDGEFRLKPGTYMVHAAYGQAGETRKVEVSHRVVTETVVLHAGGLQLDAVIDKDKPLPAEEVTFDISRSEDDAAAGRGPLVTGVKPGAIVRLSAGTYHVASHYGGVNAVMRADIEVEAGKLTRATLHHKAAEVTLKLVASPGGEALANTQWTVRDAEGKVLAEKVGAFPTMVLAAGKYDIVARNGDKTWTESFDVEAGHDRDLEVVAKGM